MKKIGKSSRDYSKLEGEYKKLEADYKRLEALYELEKSNVNMEKVLRHNVNYIKKYGLAKYMKTFTVASYKIVKKGSHKIINKTKAIISAPTMKKELKKILKMNKGKKIIVFYPWFDFNMKMYQRPQHIAVHMARKGYLYFYCTANIHENINGFEKVEDGLYITNQWKMLKQSLPKYTLQLYANVGDCNLDEFKQIESSGHDIIYEYIDDLHEDVAPISKELLERHIYALSNENIKVVATSQHLYDKAIKYRKKNIILSTNGVVYDDFNIKEQPPVPKLIKNIVEQKKPIIGYYGALASWFDYELIKTLALKKKDYNILLIGLDYDKSLKKYNYFKDFDNVFYIGTVPYKELVNYGYYCNVLTIPFVVNEVTLATSPVKVFEYMTMKKPVVTTDLPECRRYKSIRVAKDHNQFIDMVIDAAENGLTKGEIKLLEKEAKENTWDKKVDEILKLAEL